MLDDLLTSHSMDRLVYVAIMRLCSCYSNPVRYVSVIPFRVKGKPFLSDIRYRYTGLMGSLPDVCIMP